jgi:hypothetical protein
MTPRSWRSASLFSDLAGDANGCAECSPGDDQHDQQRPVEVEDPLERGPTQPRPDKRAEQTSADSASRHTPSIDRAGRRHNPPSVYPASDFGGLRAATTKATSST